MKWYKPSNSSIKLKYITITNDLNSYSYITTFVDFVYDGELLTIGGTMEGDDRGLGDTSIFGGSQAIAFIVNKGGIDFTSGNHYLAKIKINGDYYIEITYYEYGNITSWMW